MRRTNMVSLAIALSITVPLAFPDVASAQGTKKLSYEQAWAQCKKEISASVPGSDSTTSASRYTAGGACMQKYGYRLKRKN